MEKYDVKVNNLLIEINGNYWHANPLIYKENHIFTFPGNTTLLASEIWKSDKYKIELAKENGYNILVIWESDLKNKEKLIENIKNNINRENI